MAAAERIHPVLPARLPHPLGCAVPRGEQLLRRRHRDVSGDPGTQQRGQHQQLLASNFPEALAGAVSMQEQGRSRAAVVALWGGAVLASVIDTLAPEAFGEDGSFVALASAMGFFTAFVLSA